MPAFSPINPADAVRAGQRAVGAATRLVRPDHLAIARRQVYFTAPHMVMLYLYVAVAPSRWAPRPFDDLQVRRAQNFVTAGFGETFPLVPESANPASTLFAVVEERYRTRQLYVHPTGLIELLWALPTPADESAPLLLDAAEMAGVITRLARAVGDDSYRQLSRAGRGIRRWARVDWHMNVATGVSDVSGLRSWKGIRFPDREPPRSRQEWVAAPPGGYATERLRSSPRRRPPIEVAEAFLGDFLAANGYYEYETAVRSAVAAAHEDHDRVQAPSKR